MSPAESQLNIVIPDIRLSMHQRKRCVDVVDARGGET
jgi:hypothetical protein